MKKMIAASAVCLSLAGCATLESDPITVGLLTGNLDTAFDILEGTGNLFRHPDGTTNFRFVINESATNYYDKSDEKGKEDFRLYRLGSWLASKNACTNGYEITQKTITKEPVVHLYEGVCK
jgi:hypothetical protein